MPSVPLFNILLIYFFNNIVLDKQYFFNIDSSYREWKAFLTTRSLFKEILGGMKSLQLTTSKDKIQSTILGLLDTMKFVSNEFKTKWIYNAPVRSFLVSFVHSYHLKYITYRGKNISEQILEGVTKFFPYFSSPD